MASKQKWDRKKLVQDLRDARAAAASAALGADDGGTCNFDAAMLRLPGRPNEVEVVALAQEAGTRAYQYRGRGSMWNGMFSLGVPIGGQANRRTVQAEAMNKLLKERGWATFMYYQMD